MGYLGLSLKVGLGSNTQDWAVTGTGAKFSVTLAK